MINPIHLSLLVLLTLSVEGCPYSKANTALRNRAVGFQLMSNKQLQGSSLNANCQQVLQQIINCDNYVASLGERTYHGSLNDAVLTNAVCQAACETALVTARRRITGACASTPDLVPGYPVASLIETVITGWNETCIKDNGTGKYCNGEYRIGENPIASHVVLHSNCSKTSSTRGMNTKRWTRYQTRSCAPTASAPSYV